jgi:hypothetical protein
MTDRHPTQYQFILHERCLTRHNLNTHGLYIRFHGWFGFALFCIYVCWVLWLRSTDEGLEFQKEHGLRLRLPSILYLAVYVGWCFCVATRGVKVNPLAQ